MFHLFSSFGFDSPYDIQSLLIYTLIILSLTLSGCLHSIRLTAAYSIISNGNSTFELGLVDIQPLFKDYQWVVKKYLLLSSSVLLSYRNCVRCTVLTVAMF